MTTMQSSLNQIQPLTYKVDEQGEISVAGIKLKDLAKDYSTALYILCQETIEKRIQAYKSALEKHYPDFMIYYASKSLNCVAIAQLMQEQGLGLDVVSGGELYTALVAGFKAENIIFHGNNKSAEEIAYALENRVTLMLDNFYELSLIKNYLSANPASEAQVVLRLTPGIECHTHEYIKTGRIDSKFGFNLEQIEEVILKIQECPQIKLKGLHAHIGSQIFEIQPFVDSCAVLMEKFKLIKDKFGIELEELNLGGGLGILYEEQDDPPEIEKIIQAMAEAVEKNCTELGLKKPRLAIEPGRSLLGPAGMTLYKVGNIKDIPGVRKYVAVDGGMADNSRPIMYQAVYKAEIDGKVNQAKETVTVAGKYCESGDILIRDAELPAAEAGDLLVIFSTGAYNYSMASNYNRACRPAMVLVKDGKASIIIERESFADLVQRDKSL